MSAVEVPAIPFDRTRYLADQAAVLSLYAQPRTGCAELGPAAIEVAVPLARFESAASLPSRVAEEVAAADCCPDRPRRTVPAWPGAVPFGARQTLGETVGQLRCRIVPGEPLDASRSQPLRLAGLEVDFGRGDRAAGAGEGRTYPMRSPRLGAILCAAAGSLTWGSGKLRGLAGMFSFNGRLLPGFGFEGVVICRFHDPGGLIRSDREIADPRALPWSPPAVFVELKAERPQGAGAVEIVPGQRGGTRLAAVLEARSARFVTAADGYRGLRTKVVLGPTAGSLEASIELEGGDAGRPLAAYRYRVDDETTGECLGTLEAQLDGGIAVPVPGFPGLATACYGALRDGTGLFEQVEGAIAESGTVSAPARALSLLQVLQFGEGRFCGRP